MFRFAPVVLLVASATLSAAQRPADDNAFPHTKPNGRATVGPRTTACRPWRSTTTRSGITAAPGCWCRWGLRWSSAAPVKRDSFSIVMPGGRVAPLATQEQFLADSAAIRLLQQNARIFQRDVIGYFPKSADGETLRWFALPGGTVRDPGHRAFRTRRGDWRPVFQVPDAAMGRRHLSARLRQRQGPRRAADPTPVERSAATDQCKVRKPLGQAYGATRRGVPSRCGDAAAGGRCPDADAPQRYEGRPPGHFRSSSRAIMIAVRSWPGLFA